MILNLFNQSWIEIFKNIKYSNAETCICSAISIALFAGVRDHINERFKGRMPIPVPIELIIVCKSIYSNLEFNNFGLLQIIVGTLVSHFLNLNGRYKVKIVNTIGRG